MEWVALKTYDNGSTQFEHSDNALVKCNGMWNGEPCLTQYWVGWNCCPTCQTPQPSFNFWQAVKRST